MALIEEIQAVYLKMRGMRPFVKKIFVSYQMFDLLRAECDRRENEKRQHLLREPAPLESRYPHGFFGLPIEIDPYEANYRIEMSDGSVIRK